MNNFLAVVSMIKPALAAADVLEKLGDACLDTLEELVQRTDNTVDDAIVLPAIKGLRHVAGIADNDKPKLEIVNDEA